MKKHPFAYLTFCLVTLVMPVVIILGAVPVILVLLLIGYAAMNAIASEDK